MNNEVEELLCLIHIVEDGYVIEGELKKYFKPAPKKFIDIYQRFRQVMQLINQCNTIDEMCHPASGAIKKVDGF